MKKRFKLKVMYGDADGYETFKYITENENEINFLTYFLENYTKDLFDFYDRPDLLHYNETFRNNEEKLIETVNNLNDLANKVCNEDVPLLSKNTDKEEIHETLSEIINFVSDYFGWCMYHAGMDYNGNPRSYKIEDITGCTEMTRQQVITMVKEKLDMDIVITD